MPDNQDTNSINKFIRKQKGAEKICSGPCSSGRPVCDHEKLVRNVLFCSGAGYVTVPPVTQQPSY